MYQMHKSIRKFVGRIPFLKSARSRIGYLYIQWILKFSRNDKYRLEGYGYRQFSQGDEDGIIKQIFQRIGTTNETFVEFGVGDGRENNTRALLNRGWRGLWIEADCPSAQNIVRDFAPELRNGFLVFLQSFVTRENINDLILGSGISGEIDFLGIDIDGNDAHIWRAITAIIPRVVCIEYNGYYPPPSEWLMAYDPDFKWDYASRSAGASLKLLERLGKEKGYALVGCNITGVNAFFVRGDLVGNHFSSPFTAENHYRRPSYWLISSISTE